MLTRRSFLATLAAAGVAACRKSGSAAAAGETPLTTQRLDRIGIQLYSVRDEMKRDMPATLARLSEIGYREVEFAGYFGRSPADVRRLLEQTRLAAPSSHVMYDPATWETTLDHAREVGHTYVTMPWLPEPMRKSADTWRQVAASFNRAGEAAKKKGLSFAYHNHDFEFVRTDGLIPLDLLLAETDPALVSYEMDVYWTTKAGSDPLAYFRQHPTRFTMLHIKDSAGAPDHRMVDVGDGKIDFAALFRLDASQRHSVKHVFVEHDQPADPMVFAKKSFDHLNKLTY